MVEQTFTVTDPAGIHARRATILIQLANKFTSEIIVEHDSRLANLKSTMGVMSLGLEKGAVFKLRVDGRDETMAFEQLTNKIYQEKLAQ